MKKFLSLITAFITVLSMISCSKMPVASFTTDKASYKMSQTVTFINESKSGKEFAWDFGDGKKSTLENPTHAFAAAGVFAVTLTVTGSGGTASVTDSLHIALDLTGIWLKTVNTVGGFGGGGKLTGTMNMVQNEDNTLTGSFVYQNGNRTANLRSSTITDHSVILNWDNPATKFIGTISEAGNSISGTYSGTNLGTGTWSATKL